MTPAPPQNGEVVIVGGGVSGLSCARHLHAEGVRFTLLEAADRVGGRIRTDEAEGYRLDRGFQVLQTAYPEARRILDYARLDLCRFAPGAKVRIRGRFHTVADPLRRPRDLLKTLTAPIGTLGDRLRLMRRVHRVTSPPLERLFEEPETTAMASLMAEGFSQTMIDRFLVPFFGGVCLDRHIRASSRVLDYVLRMFAQGDAALPRYGMEQIPKQLARDLPKERIRVGVKVRGIEDGELTLDDGLRLSPRAIILATEAPVVEELLGLPRAVISVSETCLYFAGESSKRHGSFLMLNGERSGMINNVAIPSRVSPAYAPEGKSLFSVVLLGRPELDDAALAGRVRQELIEWFGAEAAGWRHLATYRIRHALPDQSPPTENPTRSNPMIRPGVFACGEQRGLPGIQWAMLSGRRAAESVVEYLSR